MPDTVPYQVAIRTSRGRGRGVFALKEFHAGELIERCPAIIVPPPAASRAYTTILRHYMFDWEKPKNSIAILLGYGMIYNHSYDPNAQGKSDHKTQSVDFYARRLIKKGEEITWNYNGDPHDTSPLWFTVKK